jgi:threonyl-tRNA synthetase
MLVVGKREAQEKTVTIRRLGQEKQETMSLADAIAALKKEATPPDLR